MWKVHFKDYIKFEGVKESLKNVKEKTKLQKKTNPFRTGDKLEEAIKTIIEDGGVIRVDRLTPQYDMGFGADFKFSYVKDGKNYSFFVDVTAKTSVDMQFLNIHGNMGDWDKAFCYYTEEFKMYFTLKYNHYGFFFYEKPVISLVVKGFGNHIDVDNIDTTHRTNISNIIVSLHEFVCEQGYSARASHYVQPNKNRFRKEYEAFLKERKEA